MQLHQELAVDEPTIRRLLSEHAAEHGHRVAPTDWRLSSSDGTRVVSATATLSPETTTQIPKLKGE